MWENTNKNVGVEGLPASNGVLPLDSPDGVGVLLSKVFTEHFPVEVGLLGLGRLLREPELGLGQLFVSHHFVRVVLDPVDPTVADSVAKLFLLTPQNVTEKELCHYFLV